MVFSIVRSLLIFGILIINLASCKKEKEAELTLDLPAHFPSPAYDLAQNPISTKGFALGKRLFYDRALSRDSTISCGDCHISFAAFSHPDHITSHGIDGLFGRRNAPALQNLIWQPYYFWDGGVPNLDLIALNPMQNPVEMDLSPAVAVHRLNQDVTYQSQFKVVFPQSDSINGINMLRAFSQFLSMLVSANSPYDKYSNNQPTDQFGIQAVEGLQIFNQKCAYCHSGQLFSDHAFRNNGILNDFSLDQGRYEVSALPEDIGKFKVPSLRNVAATPPYMHNGKFPTLQSVLDHYATGVKDSPTLDPVLKQNGTLGIALSSDEKSKIIAFLQTLTDNDFIREPLFQE